MIRIWIQPVVLVFSFLDSPVFHYCSSMGVSLESLYGQHSPNQGIWIGMIILTDANIVVVVIVVVGMYTS